MSGTQLDKGARSSGARMGLEISIRESLSYSDLKPWKGMSVSRKSELMKRERLEL